MTDTTSGVFVAVCHVAAQPPPSPSQRRSAERAIDSAVLLLRGLPLMRVLNDSSAGSLAVILPAASELAGSAEARQAMREALARAVAAVSTGELFGDTAVLAIMDVLCILVRVAREDENVALDVATHWVDAEVARQLSRLVAADGRAFSGVAEAAKRVLVEMAVTEATEAVVFTDQQVWAGINVCAQTASSDGGVVGAAPLRCFELAVACLLANPTAMMSSSGLSTLVALMQLTVKLLQGTTGQTKGAADPLAALAILEIDTKLAQSADGMKLMVEQLVFEEAKAAMDAILQGTADPLGARFLRNPLFSFFANASAISLSLDFGPFINVDGWLVPALAQAFEASSDEVSLTVLSEAVCKIGSTLAGLKSLAANTPAARSLRSEFQCVASSSTNARIGWMHMMGDLLGVWGDRLVQGSLSGDALEQLEDSVRVLCRSPAPDGDLFADMIWPLFRDPFRERRFAALHLTQGLCALPSTARDVAGRPGFFEYITDRTTEAHPRDLSFEPGPNGMRARGKDGAEWKFAVVQQLLRTHDAAVAADGPSAAVVPEHILAGLVEFHTKGPFWAVATEDVPIVSTKSG